MKQINRLFYICLVSILVFLISIVVNPSAVRAAGTDLNLSNLIKTESSQIDGHNVTILTLNEQSVLDALDANPGISTVLIPAVYNTAVIKTNFSNRMVTEFTSRNVSIEVQAPASSYVLPASEINVSNLAQKLGVEPDDIEISIVFAKANPEQAASIGKFVAEHGLTRAAESTCFKVEGTAAGRTIEVNKLDHYVTRTITLNQAVDINLAVGVMVDEKGALVPAPTQFTEQGGQIVAVIKQKQNGLYTVIENQNGFQDIDGHWAEQDINILAAKLIVSGVNNNNFAPENKVTRAQIATFIVRALGLEPNVSGMSFRDIKGNEWFAGSVGAAVAAGIINGYPDGTFRPYAYVTCEQAAAMIVQALTTVNADPLPKPDETGQYLTRFKDRAVISSWAKQYVAAAVKNNIISGDAGGGLNPGEYSTRAKIAVMIKKMMVKAKLITVISHGEQADSLTAGFDIVKAPDNFLTNKSPITVTGTTAPDGLATVNGMLVQADSRGNFSRVVELNLGRNKVSVVTTDSAGKETTTTRTVIYDNIPPSLTVTSPTDNLETGNNIVIVTGYTEKGSTVTVNGTTAPVDKEGNFSKAVDLAVYSNTIEIKAVDAVGNTSSVTRSVVFNDNRVSGLILPDVLQIGSSSGISVQYTLSIDGYITMKIFKENGDLVRTLAKNLFVRAGSNSQLWNGKDDNAALVADGKYKFVVEATDMRGDQIGRAEKIVTAARLPMISEFKCTPATFNPLNGETAKLSCKLSCDALIKVTIQKDGLLLNTLIANVAASGGLYTVSWDGKNNEGNLVPDAKYTIQLDAISPTDSSVKSTKNVNVVVEKEAPQIAGVSLNADSFVIGNKAVNMYFTLSENARVTLIIKDKSGKLVATAVNGVSKRAGFNSISWNGKTSGGKNVSPGVYTLCLSATDNYGKLSNVITKSVTAVTQASVIPLNSPLNPYPGKPVSGRLFSLGRTVPTEGETTFTLMAGTYPTIPRISGTGVTNSPFNPLNGESSTLDYTISGDALVTVTIVNGFFPVRTLQTEVLKSAGSYSLTWDGKDEAGEIVGDGSYNFQVTAANPLEPTLISTRSFKTSVEKEAPRITDVTVSPNPYIIGGSRLTIRFTLSEKAKVTIKCVDNNGVTVKTIMNGISKNPGSISTSWDGKDEFGSNIPEGAYLLVISAIDEFGKQSEDQKQSFSAACQSVVKKVEVTPFPFNPNSSANAQAAINYELSAAAKVTLDILMNNSPVKTVCNAELQGSGSHTVHWDGKDNSDNVVGDGIYSLRFTVVNPNLTTFTSVFQSSITVEKDIPKITNLSFRLIPSSLEKTNSVSIKYTLSESCSITAKVLKNGSLIACLFENRTNRAGANSALWDGKDSSGNRVSDGDYTVVIKAVDPFGKSTETNCMVSYTANVVTGGKPSEDRPVVNKVEVTPFPFNPNSSANAQAAINYELSAAAKVTLEILKNNNPVKTVYNAELQDSGSHTVYWDGKDNSDNVVGDGIYSLRFTVVNPNLTTFTSFYQSSITVEKEAPQITDVTVLPEPYKIGISNLTIRYTLSEKAKVTIKCVDSDGLTVKTIMNSVSKNPGSIGTSWDGKDEKGTYIPEGTYSLVISAIDEFGKQSEDQKQSFTAAYQPVVKKVEVTPFPFNPNSSANAQAAINYELSAAAKVTLDILIYNNLVKTLHNAELQDSGSHTVHWDGKDNFDKIVGDGIYSLRFTVVNPNLTTFTSVYRSSVTVEKDIPKITSLSFRLSPSFDKTNSVSIRYTLSESCSVTMEVLKNGSLIARLFENRTSRAGANSALWDGKDSSGNRVGDGSYTMVIKAVDPFGKSTETSGTVIYSAVVVPTTKKEGDSFPDVFAVKSSNPTQHSTGVPISSDIVVTFTELAKQTSSFKEIKFQVEDKSIQYSCILAGDKLTITPSSKLAYGTTYTLSIPTGAIKDRKNRYLYEPYILEFTTETSPRDRSAEVNLSDSITSTFSELNEETVTTITLDETKALTTLSLNSGAKTAVIPVTLASDMVNIELTGSFLTSLADNNTSLIVDGDAASVVLPSSAVSVDNIARQFNVDPVSVKIRIVIKAAQTEDSGLLKNQAQKLRLNLLANPIEFEVKAIVGDKVTDINSFARYVSLLFYLPQNIKTYSAGGITLNNDISILSVPTRFELIEGNNMAIIKSKYSGAYAVVANSKTFKDLKAHWAANDVGLLTSRLVIEGINNNYYGPNYQLTRAQFVTMIVKALGLKSETAGPGFRDVRAGTWYAGAVSTAVEKGIIKGYYDGTFRPNAVIKREDAAAIISQALKVADIDIVVTEEEANQYLESFKDRAKTSPWAKVFVAGAVRNGIIQGYTDGSFGPGRNITRAEAAVLIRKLLTKAEFI